MADCSKTLDFFKERQRMCDYYFNDYEEMCSSSCPFSIENNRHSVHCGTFVDSYIEKAMSVLQKWSDEHPIPKPRTYADVFNEKFPNNNITKWAAWQAEICRKELFGQGRSDGCEGDCVQCWEETCEEENNE